MCLYNNETMLPVFLCCCFLALEASFFPAVHFVDWYVLHGDRSPGHGLEDEGVRKPTSVKVLRSSHCLHLVGFVVVLVCLYDIDSHICYSLLCWFLKFKTVGFCAKKFLVNNYSDYKSSPGESSNHTPL